jgi:ferric-dicitrate binding protein FerR (iron transport regulator)
LGFHSRFDGKERIVDLCGEAYFDVAKNPDQPFIVRTSEMDIKVLGTQFNVKAYADENYTYATLNKGKIRINSNELEIDLVPDEQFVFENITGNFKKKQVDADIYSAWVKGRIVFKDETLENIMLSIGRWYDIHVFYKNSALKEERFSISLNRYENISSLLEHIEMTESVQFEINDKALIVK